METFLGGTLMNIRTEYKHDESDRVPPPPEGFREITVENVRVVSLEEAKSASPFPVVTPQYMPGGFKLTEVKFQKLIKNAAQVQLKYTASGSRYFEITEKNTPAGYVQGYGYDIEDAVVQDIKIGNTSGKMIVFKDKSLKIRWIKLGIVYQLEGNISKEEALKIVESLH